MSRVIKSGNFADLALVRPLSPPASLVPTIVVSHQEEENNSQRQRITSLEADLRKRDAAITELRAGTERAFEDGKAQGRAEGLSEAEDRQAERLALLETALATAQCELSARLASFERLAALLARESLDVLLGDPEHRAATLKKILAQQVSKIEKSSLLGVSLSREDFPDKDALASAARRAGVSGTLLSNGADVPAGGCVMTFKLGKMDVGIDQQWGVLRGLLAGMAQPEAPS